MAVAVFLLRCSSAIERDTGLLASELRD